MTRRSSHPVMRRPQVGDFWTGPDGLVRSRDQVKKLYDQAVAAWVDAQERELNDPLRYGWEPPIWKVCDALLGLPLFDTGFGQRIEERFGWTWEEWSEAMRLLLLKRSRRLRVLLLSGPNRSGKTEYAAKRTNQVMLKFENEMAWCFSQSSGNSIEIMQPALYRHLPPELRKKDIREKVAYIKHSRHGGFTESRYVLPNGSSVSLRNYSQKEETLEGPALKWVWADELIPPNFQETLEGRIGDREGWMIDTFTPIHGWSGTVNMFMHQSEIAKACTAFLVPLDKHGPDEVSAFGFYSALQRTEAWADSPKRTIPEDVHCWLETDPPMERSFDLWKAEVSGGDLVPARSQPVGEAGRLFDSAPRVARCFEPHKGVVFFQPMDSPFGNPAAVWDLWKNKSAKIIRERLYGWATKSFGGQFPLFEEKVHCFDLTQLPSGGSNYQMTDPTPGGRPFFSLTCRIIRDTVWVYREWPMEFAENIPDVPFGKWAIPSGKNGGVNDGQSGEGAARIGWGVWKYVQEWARVEGWDPSDARDIYKQVRSEEDADDEVLTHYNKISMMEADETPFAVAPGSGEGEFVVERGLDSRAASSPRIENDRSTTLVIMFQDYGLDMCLAPGIGINERVTMLNDLLDYKVDDAGTMVTPPRIFLEKGLSNLIFAMQTWTGVDGGTGATKDPVDTLCYLVGKFVSGEWYDKSEELEDEA